MRRLQKIRVLHCVNRWTKSMPLLRSNAGLCLIEDEKCFSLKSSSYIPRFALWNDIVICEMGARCTAAGTFT
jgi:hypothetical protein